MSSVVPLTNEDYLNPLSRPTLEIYIHKMTYRTEVLRELRISEVFLGGGAHAYD